MIYDVTMPVFPGMDIYPGDPEVLFDAVLKIPQDGASVHRITLGTHTGTHVDAPGHFIDGGKTVDEIDIEILAGRAVLYEAGPVIGDQLPGLSAERVIIKTGYRPGIDKEYPYMTEESASYLAAKGVRLVGMDTPSPDRPGAFGCHRIFLESGIVLVENLILAGVPAGEYYIYCLPLPLKGMDGAPARVLLENLR